MLAPTGDQTHVGVVRNEAWAAQRSYYEQRAAHASLAPATLGMTEANNQQIVTERHGAIA